MLAKSWKKIGLIILIIACLFNITSKLVKRVSFTDNVKSTVSNTVNNVVTKVNGSEDKEKNNKKSDENNQNVLKNE